jgi:hypothetical protein
MPWPERRKRGSIEAAGDSSMDKNVQEHVVTSKNSVMSVHEALVWRHLSSFDFLWHRLAPFGVL